MKRKCLFVPDISAHEMKEIFNDLKSDPRVDYLESPCRELNIKLLRLVRKIHLSRRINDVIELPFKGIWGSVLDDYIWEADTEYYILFWAVAPYPIPVKRLKKLQKEHNVKFVLLMGGPLFASKVTPRYLKQLHFDSVYTIEDPDVEKYGFLPMNTIYSTVDAQELGVSDGPEHDLLFVGRDKGRLSLLLNVYEYLKQNGILPYYRLSRVKRKDEKYKDEILYNHAVPYRKVLQEVQKSNCLLEIIQRGGFAATLRYYEAICYNKKLLTSNKNVVNLPFYDPRYIHVFERPEDIDCDWVKDKSPVDYGYDGRFSPKKLIDRIMSIE